MAQREAEGGVSALAIQQPQTIQSILDANAIVGEMRTGPRRFWTGREEKILRETYPGGGVLACVAALPGRTAKSIYQRANMLGLLSPVSVKRGRASYERWTTNEHTDALIRRTYAQAPQRKCVQRLAQTIGRPCWWVSKRAARLGCIVPRFKDPPWSEAEVEIVAGQAHKPPDALSRILKSKGFKRTPTAISVKIKRIGASTADPNHNTGCGLAKLMGVDAKCVTRWIEKGWLKASRRGTDRVAQQGGDEWWIRRKDIRRFVVENVGAIDLRKVEKHWFVDLLTQAEAA